MSCHRNLRKSLTEVLVESHQDVKLPESGQHSDRRSSDSARDCTCSVLKSLLRKSPVRNFRTVRPNKLESLTTTVDDVTQFQQQQLTELAMPADAGEKGPKQVAAEDPAADLKTAFEQSMADVFKPEMSRTQPVTGRPDDSERMARSFATIDSSGTEI